MKLKKLRPLIAAVSITMAIVACHSQKEIMNTDGTKTKVRVNNGAPRMDGMMQGDTMKRDH